jgi:hypothetical protein
MTDRTDSLHALIAEMRQQGFGKPWLRHSCGSCSHTDEERAEIDGWNAAVKKCADRLEALLLEGVERPQGGEEQKDQSRVGGFPEGAHGDLPRPCTE